MVYITSSETCGLYWFDPDPQSDDYGLLAEGGTLGDCSPNTAGYGSYQDALSVKLNHPCCVASDARFDRADAGNTATGPYVADSGSGHVDHYQWFFNKGKTIAGGNPADCAVATLPATTDPAAANFCTITGLARQVESPYGYAFGEMGRGGGTGNLYVVASGVMQSAAAFDAIAALAVDRSNNLLVSDGASSVIRYPCCPLGGVVTEIAGRRASKGYLDAPDANDARFRDPKGIAVAFDGSL